MAVSNRPYGHATIAAVSSRMDRIGAPAGLWTGLVAALGLLRVPAADLAAGWPLAVVAVADRWL